MIKSKALDHLLVEWLTKSLLPPITKDVTTVGETTEE
jgi:hypothetical protein